MSKYKRVRRIIFVPCPDCYATGLSVGGKCQTCQGAGELKRVVNEIVREDEEVEAL